MEQMPGVEVGSIGAVNGLGLFISGFIFESCKQSIIGSDHAFGQFPSVRLR